MATVVLEENGHVIGIPDRYLKVREVETALIESGARVAVATCETVEPA